MSCLTRVCLVHVPDGLSLRLRFGRPMHEDAPDDGMRHVYFRPGMVFARVASVAGDARRLAVLRAAAPGERVDCLEGIAPGAQLLLHATTPAMTRLAQEAIAAIEAQGIAPEHASEDYWHVLHQRLAVGGEPPRYLAAEHAAALARRALQP